MACSPFKFPFFSFHVSDLPLCDLQKLKIFQIFQKFEKCIKKFSSVPRTPNLNFTRIQLLIIVLHAFKQWTGLYIHPVCPTKLSVILRANLIKFLRLHWGNNWCAVGTFSYLFAEFAGFWQHLSHRFAIFVL